MTDLENTLRTVDFSRYSDLKGRLARELFDGQDPVIPICSLSDIELEGVNAAGGFQYYSEEQKND